MTNSEVIALIRREFGAKPGATVPGNYTPPAGPDWATAALAAIAKVQQ